MKRNALGCLACLGAALGCDGGDTTSGGAFSLSREALMDPQSCADCHPKHYEEWSTSMHAYASDDPIFVAMNRRGQREAAIGPFCVNCHAPVAVREGATFDGLNLEQLPSSLKGVTCYFCHSVDAVEGTHNNPLRLAQDLVLRGPFDDPVQNTAHRSAYSTLHDRDQLESSQLCGSCHDIVNELGTHLERTFAEWQGTVFAQPVVGTTCGQCHMDQSRALEPAARAPGVFSRRTHSHRFPAVDLPLTGVVDDASRDAVQSFLDTSLQSAVCVRGVPGSITLQVVLDNVAAGHRWPSGAAQDRRAWVEVIAYAGSTVLYESGVVAAGASPTASSDPDLWLIRDCLFDQQGRPAHMFWEAADYESNLLPGQLTFDPSDPRYYQNHVFQTYPRDGSVLAVAPDRVSVRIFLQPIGLDVFDDLVQSGDLADTPDFTVQELRSRLAPLAVGQPLEWTAAAATERFVEGGLPIACASATNLSASAAKVPALNNMRCSP